MNPMVPSLQIDPQSDPKIDRSSGQVLVEFLATSGTMALILAATASLLKAQWDRARCAYLSFESARSRLSESEDAPDSLVLGISRGGSNGTARIRVSDTGARVVAEATCGPKAHEIVSLPKLEYFR